MYVYVAEIVIIHFYINIFHSLGCVHSQMNFSNKLESVHNSKNILGSAEYGISYVAGNSRIHFLLNNSVQIDYFKHTLHGVNETTNNNFEAAHACFLYS